MAFGVLLGKERQDAGRIAVPKSELFVEHGAHVVVKAAVVLAVVPLLTNGVGELDDLRGFERREALVGMPEGLVVDVLVHVALGLEERDDVLVAPYRPGVRSPVDLGLIAPANECLVDVAGEVAGIAGTGSAKGLDVVHGVVGVLGAGERLDLGDPDVELLGRLGVGGVEELERPATELADFTGPGDAVGGCDIAHLFVHQVVTAAQADGDEPAVAVGQEEPEGVAHAP